MIIRDVAHAHDDTTQGTMAIVSSDVALYTTFMSSTDDTNDFYQTFLAVAETINVHGGSTGYHPQLFSDHFTVLYGGRKLDPDTMTQKELMMLFCW